MYESREKYDNLVKHERIVLEWALGRSIHHSDAGFCPKCGYYGNYDINGLGFAPDITNSIYYSTVYGEWRCRKCDFSMCA